MNSIIVKCFVLICFSIFAQAELNNNENSIRQIPSMHSSGAPVDEVVVESSLFIKPKQKLTLRRRTRNVPRLFSGTENRRVKRNPQFFGFPNQIHQSQSTANAAANNHFANPFGFGASAANAQAQAFQSQGPAASFGASSAGTHTQSLTGNRNGAQAAIGASMSQTYTLPNGQVINFAHTNNFANGPNGNNAGSRGSSVSVSKPFH